MVVEDTADDAQRMCSLIWRKTRSIGSGILQSSLTTTSSRGSSGWSGQVSAGFRCLAHRSSRKASPVVVTPRLQTQPMHYIVMQLARNQPQRRVDTVATIVNVQTRIDPAIREKAELVLKSIGLTISDVMRVTLTRIARDKAVPFELFAPNETTIAAMREARAGGGKRFNSVAELMAHDNEDD